MQRWGSLFGSLAFLCLACVSAWKPQPSGSLLSIEEMKRLHPEFDLFLCGNVGTAENFVHSRSLWKHGERSICKDTESDIAFRLTYWKMGPGTIVIRMEKSHGHARLVSKWLEYTATGNQIDSLWFVQKDHPISLEGADSLMNLLRQVDFPNLIETRVNCLDGNIWQVEIKEPQAFQYYRLSCNRNKDLSDFGKALREKIGLSYPID